MCHPLGNRGHLQPLGKEGSKPRSVACRAVQTLWLCVRTACAPGHTSKEEGQAARDRYGSGTEAKKLKQSLAFHDTVGGRGGGQRDGWVGRN